jgi:hypothetical protein
MGVLSMKKGLRIFIAVGFISLFCLLINIFVTALPDWLIRTAGIVALVCVARITYTALRKNMGHKK